MTSVSFKSAFAIRVCTCYVRTCPTFVWVLGKPQLYSSSFTTEPSRLLKLFLN